MTSAPGRQIYEYRQVESLDEVNQLAEEEGFDLFQALTLEGRLLYVLRRVREPEANRRVGFARSGGSAPQPPSS
ncbi:MAG: hypothetical protein ACREN4_00065 [Candidatus Dormibacteria bacterium]